jgi:RNA polymerase sigma-70 factor (ECF subfamily)
LHDVGYAKDLRGPSVYRVDAPGKPDVKVIHADKALARRILQGDEAAFRALFDEYFPRLYRFAMARMGGDRESSLEIVQQTMCNAIENLDRYRGEAALFTWFCQICRNTLIDYCRARKRDASRLVLIEDRQDVRAILDALTGPFTEEPETAAWRSDLRRLIQSTLDRLTPRHADVLEWKYVDGMSVKEIAGRLGIGAKAAESLLTRARGAFREAMTALTSAPEVLGDEPLSRAWLERNQ